MELRHSIRNWLQTMPGVMRANDEPALFDLAVASFAKFAHVRPDQVPGPEFQHNLEICGYKMEPRQLCDAKNPGSYWVYPLPERKSPVK